MKYLNMTYGKIKKVAIVYCCLPLFCFFLFYMASWVGIASAALLLGSFVFCLKNIEKEESNKESISIPIRIVIIFVVVAVIWSFLGGQGGHFYQSPDWNWRNAIFRDIVYKGWPVIYQEFDKALVYYIGYWLPSALITKILAIPFPKIMQTDIAFFIANQLLWIWTICGIVIVLLLVLFYAKPKNEKKMFIIPGLLAFFSGLDILGVIYQILTKKMMFGGMHIEWWMPGLQFSSITTCLFWVYNQCVIPWIVIACVMQEKKVCNYMILGIGALVSGPLPFLGIVVYMVINFIIKIFKEYKGDKIKKVAKEIFSISNIMALPIVGVIYLYYKSNGAVNVGVNRPGISILGIVNVVPFEWEYVGNAILFLFLEVGIYLILLFKTSNKNPQYYITIIVLCMAPFFTIGTESDFVMRFSIPGIMQLVMLIARDVCGERWRMDIRGVLLCITLMLGAVTPGTEIMRGYNSMLVSGKIVNVNDSVKSLDQDFDQHDINFVTYKYKEQPFFKYMIH